MIGIMMFHIPCIDDEEEERDTFITGLSEYACSSASSSHSSHDGAFLCDNDELTPSLVSNKSWTVRRPFPYHHHSTPLDG